MKKVLSFVLALVLMLSVFPMVSITAQGNATEDKITGATLNIGSSLTLDYYATIKSVEPENVTMRFTSSSGRVTTDEKGVYDAKAEAYKFSYTGINPQCMADDITAELICDGKVLATYEVYSVKAYCDRQSTKTETNLGYTTQGVKAYRTLMADMLIYGSEAQKYKGYNTDNPADASEWIKDYASTFANPSGVRVVDNKDEYNKVKSVGLNLSNVIKIYFKFVAEDEAIVKLNDRTVEKNEIIENNDGTCMLYTDGIKATEFDDVYTLTIEKNGEEVSKVDYNVNAYIANKYTDDEVGAIVKALYNYGVSAENYIKVMKAQTEGGEFELGEEDMLDTESPAPSSAPIPTAVTILSSNYDDAKTFADTGWSTEVLGGIAPSLVDDGNGGKCVRFERNTSGTWYSPTLSLENHITKAGYYTITFKYKVEGATAGASPFKASIRTNGDTTFSNKSGNYYFGLLGDAKAAVNGQWETMTVNFSVEEVDVKNTASQPWWFCMDYFTEGKVSDIYIDDFVITGIICDFKAEPNKITETQTWVSNELVLISDEVHNDPFNDVTVDLILTKGETTYKVPGFWDGGNIWRVRFVCPEEGTWTYTTECKEDASLNGITNTLTCTKYSGDLDIYKHGFVKTQSNTRYFMYADGTPFFYLGDTHWSLGDETIEMVKTITDKRVEQGYTVYQSQPIGAIFTYHDGITSVDVLLMQEYDEKFKIIADAGLVHANAQFFFASDINQLVENFGGYTGNLMKTVSGTSFYDLSNEAKEYLDRICRYWVARYSSYPVMWTLGQEVDDDLYWEDGGHNQWSYVNNPFRYVAEYLYEHDPYKSPLSAHQESHAHTQASTSAFRDVEEHTWYANQWKPCFDDNTKEQLGAAKDYWNYNQGKPVVNYEANYCGFWTKDFGARAQGWAAYLSGMFGHGYGAHDTWSYLNPYDENETTEYKDGVDIITSEEKVKATWEDALNYESGKQLGYMREFFEGTVGDWYNLIPRFKDADFFTTNTRHYYLASNENNSEIVFYFYNFSDATLADEPNSDESEATQTGYLKKLGNSTYNYKWFNPRTGQFEGQGTITTSSSGSVNLPTKSTGDMVLYLYK